MLTNDRQVQALKPRDKVYWQAVKSPHGGGLALRVNPAGSKSWFHRYRFNGKQDAYQVGVFPTVGLKEAREAHAESIRLLNEGINPKRARREQKAQNQNAWSMAELFARWVESYANTPSIRTKRLPSSKTVEGQHWRWVRYLKDRLGDLSARSVTRTHVTSTIADIAETQSREEARKCLTTLRSMLEFAEARGQVESNQAIGIEPARLGAMPARSRERVLSLVELRKLWQAIEETRFSASTAAALKLIILTGQRRGELVRARWENIDLDTGIWLIPAEDNKSRRAHTVYLSDPAVDLLRSLNQSGPFVFASNRSDQHIGADSLTKAVARLQSAPDSPLTGVDGFHVHDLRRSVATALGEHCAVQPHVIERMLNHLAEDKLQQTYQRGQYAEEQRRAWQAWGAMVQHQIMTEPENVVPFMVRSMQS